MEDPGLSAVGGSTGIEDTGLEREVPADRHVDDMTDAEIDRFFVDGPFAKMPTVGEDETPADIVRQAKRLLVSYRHLIREGGEPSLVRGFTATVAVKEGTLPVQSRVYRHAPAVDKHLREWVAEMEKAECIEPSTSPWRSGVICVPKGSGGVRCCVDLRGLNKTLQPVTWVMPTVPDILDEVSGRQYISVCDLKSAFHQIPVDNEEDRDRLTFCTAFGCWRWRVMPFGLSTAPAFFQRCIDTVVGDMRYRRSALHGQGRGDQLGDGRVRVVEEDGELIANDSGCAIAYMDDICAFGDTAEGHLADLRRLFRRLDKYNCRLAPSKCFIFKKQAAFLGHLVTSEGCRPDPLKVQALDAFTLDKLKKPRDVKVFLQTIGYMRKFVKDFAKIAQPLSKYLKAGARLKPGLVDDPEAQAAFSDLRGRLACDPILVPPDYTKTFECHTDGSSKNGLGAALLQRDEEGRLRAVMYASRSLRGATAKNPNGGERGYIPYELECAAAVWGIQVFHKYLIGRKFVLVTDHSALKRINERTVGRTIQWASILMQYSFEVQHRAGAAHGLPDGLSRYPLQGTSPYGEPPLDLLAAVGPVPVAARAVRDMVPVGEGGGGVAVLREEGYVTRSGRVTGRVRHSAPQERLRISREERAWMARDTEEKYPGHEESSMNAHGGQSAPRIRADKSENGSQEAVDVGGSDPHVDVDVSNGDINEHDGGVVDVREDDADASGDNGGEMDVDEDDHSDTDSVVGGSKVYDQKHALRMTVDVFLREQQADEKCRTIRTVLAAPLPEEGRQAARTKAIGIKSYFYERGDGLLVRRFQPVAVQGAEAVENKGPTRRERALQSINPDGRIVVPERLISDVLLLFHGLPITGHVGRNKTEEAIRQRFYWGGLAADVRRRVQACHLCQLRKPPRPTRHIAPAGFTVNAPWEMVVIDVVGPLPASSGCTKLLTCVDVFSKYPLAIPIPNEKSETVARMLQKHLFSIHGYPKLLLSDRAKGFVSAGLRWLCRRLGVAKINTTGLIPKGASPVERHHRFLNAALTIVCNDAKDDWDLQIDSVLFAFRISVHETNGYSPFFLNHGRHPRLPLPVLDGLREGAQDERSESYVQKMTAALESAFEWVRERQLATLRKNERVQLGLGARASDQEVEEARSKYERVSFQPGELISFWEPEAADKEHWKPKKLQFRYRGPYPVVRKDGSHYIVNRRGKEILVNPNRMRKYYVWDEEYLDDDVQGPSRLDRPQSRQQGHVNPTPSPQPGQLVVVRHCMSRDQPFPFRVAKVLGSEDDLLRVQWFGNRRNELVGPYHGGWLESRQRAANRGTQRMVYYREVPVHHLADPYTDITSGTEVTVDDVVCWGFRLTYDDKIPRAVQLQLHRDPEVTWTLPESTGEEHVQDDEDERSE
jgi:hypothetical protein